jgi:hypothetical protein
MSDHESVVMPVYRAMCDLTVVIKKTVEQAIADQAAHIAGYADVKDLSNLGPEFLFFIGGGALISLGERHFAPAGWSQEDRDAIIRELARTTVSRLISDDGAEETIEKFRNAFDVFSQYSRAAFVDGDPKMLSLFMTKLTPAFERLPSGDTAPSAVILRRFQAAVLVFATEQFGPPGAATEIPPEQTNIPAEDAATPADDGKSPLQALAAAGAAQLAEGRTDDALRSLREGLALAEREVRDDPASVESQQALAAFHGYVGGALVAQDNLDEALESFRRGLAVSENLTKSHHGLQRDVAAWHERIADVLAAQGKWKEADQSYNQYLFIMRPWVRDEPGDYAQQREFIACYDKLGRVQAAQGETNRMLGSYRLALAVAERVAQANPDNYQDQADLADWYQKVGDAHMEAGNYEDATQCYQKSRAINERL